MSVKEKAGEDLSGVKQGGERERTAIGVETTTDVVKTGFQPLTRDKSGGNLFTVQSATGIEAA